jgi:hypothetical protein
MMTQEKQRVQTAVTLHTIGLGCNFMQGHGVKVRANAGRVVQRLLFSGANALL